MRATRLFFLMTMAALLCGCGGPRAVLGLDVAAGHSASAAVVPVYVATTRAKTDDRAAPYSAGRSQTLNFSRFDIGIPPNREPGDIAKTGYTPDPAQHFVALGHEEIEGRRQFIARLDAALAQRAPEDREIFIFVHGYNNNVADSVFRAAQIAHDYNVRAVTLHYAWPSGGSLPLYVYDRDSAVIGRGGLVETIEIAAETKAKRVILVGHSMGSYVTMEALRDLAITGRGRTLKRLGGVVLAAPDIDVDAFQSQVRDIGELPMPFIIVVSRHDRALGVSRRLAGGHLRVGSGGDTEGLVARRITVLDASDVDGGAHNVFASSPSLIAFIGHSGLMRHLIEAGDGSSVGEAAFSDAASVIEGAAAVVLLLPGRILGGMAGRSR